MKLFLSAMSLVFSVSLAPAAFADHHGEALPLAVQAQNLADASQVLAFEAKNINGEFATRALQLAQSTSLLTVGAEPEDLDVSTSTMSVALAHHHGSPVQDFKDVEAALWRLAGSWNRNATELSKNGVLLNQYELVLADYRALQDSVYDAEFGEAE